MNRLLNRFYEILEIINKSDLSDKFVIIGSWAYFPKKFKRIPLQLS